MTQTYAAPALAGSTGVNYRLHWRKLKDATAQTSAIVNFNLPLKHPGQSAGINSQNTRTAEEILFRNAGTNLEYRVIDGNLGEYFNPILLAEIELPNGERYKFSYDQYGRLAQIDYPTGGREKFTYSQIEPLAAADSRSVSKQTNFGVTLREVFADTAAGTTPVNWSYGVTASASEYTVSVTAPDGTRSESLLHRSNPSSCTDCFFGYDKLLAGRAYEQRSYTSGNQLLTKKLTTWTTSLIQSNFGWGEWHPRATKEESIVYDPATGGALSASTVMEYDDSSLSTQISAPLNVKTVKQYGYTTSAGSLGALQKSIETTYLTDSNYAAKNMRSLPQIVQTKDVNQTVVAKSQFFYDETTPAASGTASGWQAPANNYRGNPTRTRSWSDVNNNQYIDTQAGYDNFGNVKTITDGKGNTTTTNYSATYNYAFPTSVTTAAPGTNSLTGATSGFVTSTVYDFNSTTNLGSGLPTSTTDANNQTTTIAYDSFLRPWKVTAPNGQQTITDYGVPDSTGILPVGQRFVHTKTQIDSTNWAESRTWFDGLGRTQKTQKKDSAGDVFVESKYDQYGRAWKSSNPYRAGTLDADKKWSENVYDTAGRIMEVLSPLETGQTTAAKVQTAYSLATSGNQLGTVVTVTDQAGKQRRSVTDALGQLARVDEPDVLQSDQLGGIGSPYQATVYSYDALGNLKTVAQGAQTRSFVYDSLSRLKSATNPESGVVQYGYDNNGNLTSKTDARPVTTTYSYDNLNRLLTRSYSDSTPAASYFYDNLTNAKGKLIKVSSSVSATEYTAFDAMGRVTAHKQTTDGTAYTTAYVYNLSGAVMEETYPSGRVVKNVLDADGGLSIVQSKKNASAGYWNYASHFSYTASGAVSSMQLGNGRWESTQFNNRLQPTQIALGTTQNTTNLLKLDYTYGTTDNNGNVKTQTITVPSTPGQNNGFTATQTYNYDSLNRLKDASETISGNQTWKQTFNYDRFGNRTFNASQTTTLGSCSQAVCNPSINTADNRFNAGQGYSYDKAGNLKTDAEGKQFAYDAENKQTEVKNQYSQSIGTYFYDADGKRVKKVVPSTGETTIFIYNAAGKLVAEYSTIVETTNAKVGYLTADHLGSPRIVTDRNGNVTSRRDFLPFGEDLYTPQRTAALGYQTDSVRQRFTGYEKDQESDLDFAQARYYNNKHGRFTSADEPFADQDENNPQTWNLYTYSRNNPIRYTDPTGRGPWTKFVNWLNYGVWGEEEDVQKSEDQKRQWLRENNFYQQSPDGKWYPIDPDKMNRGAVWYFYNKYQLAIAEGRLTDLTPEQQAAANILPPITAAPTAATTSNPTQTSTRGPSGRVSTEKYLEKNWDKATFGNVRKSIEYHVGKHGRGLSPVEYTQRALKAFKDSGATRSFTTDKLGRQAVQVVSKEGTGLFTKQGKIIWFHPK